MNRPRSPIEMMVDKACGLDPNTPAPERKPSPPEHAAEILLEIAAAAKVWHRNRRKGAARLAKAVRTWKEIGG